MKKYLFVLIMVISLSSCIKVEDANLCSNAPPKPSLASYAITIPTTQYYETLSVLSPDLSAKYVWFDPYGDTISGATEQIFVVYGSWKVIEQKNSCSSDTTKFTLIPLLTGCNGTGLDSVLIGTTVPDKLSFENVSNYYGSYQIQFQDAFGQALNIYFPGPPVTGEYRMVSNVNDLTSFQCNVTFNNEFVSQYGNLLVNVSGNNISLQFCGASFYDNIFGGYQNGSGYLHAVL